MELNKSDILVILKEYGITECLSYNLIDYSNSFIYHIKTKNGEFILKSQKDSQNTVEEIKWQKKVTDYLFKKGINCQTIIETKKGEVVINYNKKEYHLLTYIEGKVLHDDYDKKTYKDITKNIALMQKESLNFNKGEGIYTYLNVEKFIKDGPKDYYSKDNIEDYNEL
ncbi:MAG: hypothetical protein PHN56_00985, partial [Candidatus Nanoarchaeia archaeon]|nr:hypothetical protein [Candidatus Nanoarchaeia archaeon]